MDALTLMLGCFVVTIVWALVGCLSCKRKLTDEEVQQKYFEKFRKRHILQEDTGLNNRVDFIRKASDTKNTMAMSVTSSAMNHTYEDISLDQQTQPHDTNDRQEHSFFDESFQTVIEASTDSYMSNPTNGPRMEHLSVPNRASYLTLRPESSLTCLHSDTFERAHNSQGLVNSAFSETSLAGDNNVATNDTYLVPKCGPTIRVIKPSTRGPGHRVASCEDITGNTGEEVTEVCSSNRKSSSDSANIDTCSFNENDLQNDELRFKNLQKLLMEGHSYNAGARTPRRQSYENSNSLYEKLRESRLDNNTYRSLSSLVIPSIHGDKPRRSTDSSKQSDNTYESITAELSNELLRGGVNDMDFTSPDVFPPQQFETPRNTRGIRRSETSEEGLNDLNKSPDHTYESVKHSYSIGSSGSPDLAVVIIGRRKNDLYGSVRSACNYSDNVSQDSNFQHLKFGSEIKKLNIENIDRYSPFPSSKKLAIKSSFKPPPSPRHPVIDTISGGVTPYRIPDSIGSMGKSFKRFSVENLEPHTPEITVNNTPTVFYSPKKQYFQPSRGKDTKKHPFISPLCTYETLKARMNLRSNYLGNRTPDRRNSLGNKTPDCRRNSLPSSSFCESNLPSISDRRKSLPSVSDQFDTEIKVHCDMNQFTSSTPFFAVKQIFGNNI